MTALTKYLILDGVRTQLADPIDASDTSFEVSVGDGSLFGTPTSSQPVIITVEELEDNSDPLSNVVKSEKMLCEGRTGDLLTDITRGFDSDTPQGFSANSYVSIYPVRKHWNDLYSFLEAPEFEVLTMEDVASAVNKFKMKNSATGNALELLPDSNGGSDTNVSMIIRGKGTGIARIAERNVFLMVTGYSNAPTVGDGAVFFVVPPQLNGMNLVSVQMGCITAGTTSTMLVQLHNKTDAQDMLSTRVQLDSGETSSDTAATAAVINGSYDDVATGDVIRVDVDQIHTTPAQGIWLNLGFELP